MTAIHLLPHIEAFAVLARRDDYAERQPNGGYRPARRPLDTEVLRRHLNGGPHAGAYLLAAGSDKTQLAVLDLDDHDGQSGWPAMQAAASRVAAAAKRMGLKPWPARSGGGKGIHLLFHWTEPQDCRSVRLLLSTVIASEDFEDGAGRGIAGNQIEVFPKQDRVTDDGYGSLIALPFARQSVPLNEAFEPIDTPLEWLPSPPRPIAPAPSAEEETAAVSADAQDVRDALHHLQADDYDLWIKVGLALKQAFPSDGLAIFDAWSATCEEKYEGEARTRQRWNRFRPRPGGVTIATIFHLAREAGWAGRRATATRVEPLVLWNAGTADYRVRPRQWLLGNTFCKGVLSGLVATGAAGKTALRLRQAMSVATGKGLTGEHVFRRGKVFYLTLEDDDDELKRRIKAVKINCDVKDAELDGWFFVATPKGKRLVERDRHGNLKKGPLYDDLVARIEEARIGEDAEHPALIVIDPFVKASAADENSNNEVDYVATLLTELAIRYDVAVDVLHHTAKASSGQAGDANRGRGASALKDAMRLGQTLTTMTTAEADGFAIAEDQRRFYVRLDGAKVNIAPPAAKAQWFQLTGVKLGNPDETYMNGDEVATCVPWSPPNLMDGLTDAAVTAIFDQLARGPSEGHLYSLHSRATDRAAWKAVQAHCQRKTEVQCKTVIKKWKAAGYLKEDDYDDPDRGEPCKGLVVVRRPPAAAGLPDDLPF